jgi:hypothetical protein
MQATPAPAPAPAAEPAKDEAIHEELRAVRKGLLDAVDKADWDGVLGFLHPRIVFTAQNGEVSRGREGVRAYLNKMTKGPNRRVERFSTAAEADDLSLLLGDGAGTALSWGHSDDHFTLTDGSDFVLKSRWTATLVKEEGRWLIVGFHVSANLFDNPVLRLVVEKTALYTGVAAVLVGLVAGIVLGWLVAKKRARRGVP